MVFRTQIIFCDNSSVSYVAMYCVFQIIQTPGLWETDNRRGQVDFGQGGGAGGGGCGGYCVI